MREWQQEAFCAARDYALRNTAKGAGPRTLFESRLPYRPITSATAGSFGAYPPMRDMKGPQFSHGGRKAGLPLAERIPIEGHA